MTAGINLLALAALAVACIGILSSSIFLVLSLAGAAKFHRESEEQGRFAEKRNKIPGVALLKPVHGAEPRLEGNIESFFQQDYPEYGILFAAGDENAAAL